MAVDNLGTTEASVSPVPRRFSPVYDRQGRPVPVLYAGEDLGCALGESVFHDLPDDSGVPAEIFRSDLLTLRAGSITTGRDLWLSDLRDLALARYGVSRDQVIATPSAGYETTRRWAQLSWETTEHAGLVWHSRRSPERLAYLIFVDPPGPADRHRAADRRVDLVVADPPLLLADGPGLGAVMTAASERNVTVIIS